ncbi:MAG: hypothetical protein ACYC69_15365 [Thermodesulfovibrionales bacterium]
MATTKKPAAKKPAAKKAVAKKVSGGVTKKTMSIAGCCSAVGGSARR